MTLVQLATASEMQKSGNLVKANQSSGGPHHTRHLDAAAESDEEPHHSRQAQVSDDYSEDYQEDGAYSEDYQGNHQTEGLPKGVDKMIARQSQREREESMREAKNAANPRWSKYHRRRGAQRNKKRGQDLRPKDEKRMKQMLHGRWRSTKNRIQDRMQERHRRANPKDEEGYYYWNPMSENYDPYTWRDRMYDYYYYLMNRYQPRPSFRDYFGPGRYLPRAHLGDRPRNWGVFAASNSTHHSNTHDSDSSHHSRANSTSQQPELAAVSFNLAGLDYNAVTGKGSGKFVFNLVWNIKSVISENYGVGFDDVTVDLAPVQGTEDGEEAVHVKAKITQPQGDSNFQLKETPHNFNELIVDSLKSLPGITLESEAGHARVEYVKPDK